MELAEKCVVLLEISVNDIEMENEPFARGMFGKVYMAKWRKEDVVVKVIRGCRKEKAEHVKREAQFALRLNHKNVINVFGITRVKRKRLGIVMEKAEHGSLDIWIGKIYREKLVKMALDIIDGLEYVHSQHLIHIDIKPENILMCGSKEDMIPKIADFGVPEIIYSLMTHQRVGQEIYMAPEVKQNLRYNFTADIYSLAMMLFEMFNEQLVREASDEVMYFIMGVCSGRIGNIPKSCKVPAYLRNVIKRGWSEKPKERPTLSDYRSTLIMHESLEISVKDIETANEPFALGWFGKVYMAQWRKENVVVKVIRVYREENAENVEREAQFAVRLNHKNVINVFGITRVKRTRIWMVMEKAEHGSLATWIGKIDHEKLAKIALGIVDGLEYVHSQKVIHIDMKPENILMCGSEDDMIPKIADFGVAKIIYLVMTHSRARHEIYVAPEVRLDLRYNFTADIYSLAMILFEMFNEQLVREVSDEANYFIRYLQSGRIDEINKVIQSCKVPAYLRNVIKRGWSENPEKRPTLSEYRSTLRGSLHEL